MCTCPSEAAATGSLLDVLEALLGAPAEAPHEGLAHLVEGTRRHLVLQALELLGVHRRQEPAHDRQHLPELDVDAAQAKHAAEQALGVRFVDTPPPPPEPVRQAHPLGPRLRVALLPAEELREPELQHVAREDEPEDPHRADEADEEVHGRRGRIAALRPALDGLDGAAYKRGVRPDLSVLLAYRDAEATIDEALESVLAQRGPSFEVLAVDDGSRDGGPARVARLAARDRRVRCLATGGVGLAPALDLAAGHAGAPLFARMDADDVALPGRFSAELDLLASDPRLGAVGTRVEAFPEEAVGEGLRRYVAWQNALVTPADHRRALFVEAPLCHPSVVLTREAFEAVGGYRHGDFPEDYILWLRLDAAGFALAKVPEVQLRWRHRPGRMTFADPRLSPERFRALKALHLAGRLRRAARPIEVWGAGPTGRRFARALEAHGLRADRFIDIDPKKVGRTARGAAIVDPGALVRGATTVLVAVGARGARAEVRAHLLDRSFVEGDDFFCVA